VGFNRAFVFNDRMDHPFILRVVVLVETHVVREVRCMNNRVDIIFEDVGRKGA
jgi:hypothetical protein